MLHATRNYGGLQTEVLVKLFNSYCCSFYWPPDFCVWCLLCSVEQGCQEDSKPSIIVLLWPVMKQYHLRIQFQIMFLRFIHQMLNSTNDVVPYLARVTNVSFNTILGQNISYIRYNYDVNCDDWLYDNITRVSDTDFPDLIHQGLINCYIDLFCARNCSDVLHGFTSEITEKILYDSWVN